MKFRTEIHIKKSEHRLSYRKPLLMMGSCFTENMGSYLSNYLFKCTVNPFGVTYNPFSLKKGIEALLYKEEYLPEDLQFRRELYFSFDHYTKFSDPVAESALEKINTSFQRAKDSLHQAGTLILTFGTAYTYKYLKSGEVVNNCHKIPASEFERRMLGIDEMVEPYLLLIDTLHTLNPDLHILFTLSPVRHLKDGLIENQKSKASLLMAIHRIVEARPVKCSYFPAYEIMMDDLRDYRYYKEDLLHPNEQAVDYIWQHFSENYIDAESLSIMKELDPVLKAFTHRPLHTSTKEYHTFRTSIDEKVRKLKENYSFLNWSVLE